MAKHFFFLSGYSKLVKYNQLSSQLIRDILHFHSLFDFVSPKNAVILQLRQENENNIKHYSLVLSVMI